MDRQSRRACEGERRETAISLQNGKRLVQVSANAVKQGEVKESQAMTGGYKPEGQQNPRSENVWQDNEGDGH